jgi:hypothetical protein
MSQITKLKEEIEVKKEQKILKTNIALIEIINSYKEVKKYQAKTRQ